MHKGMIDGWPAELTFSTRLTSLHVWPFYAFAKTFESPYYKYFKENVLLIQCIVEFYEEIEDDFLKNPWATSLNWGAIGFIKSALLSHNTNYLDNVI